MIKRISVFPVHRLKQAKTPGLASSKCEAKVTLLPLLVGTRNTSQFNILQYYTDHREQKLIWMETLPVQSLFK